MTAFNKEFTHFVKLTERVYMQGEDQRIERTLTDNNDRVICREDYPALSSGGKLGAVARQITELSCVAFDNGIGSHNIFHHIGNISDSTKVLFRVRFRLQLLKFKNHLIELVKKYGFFKHKTTLS